MKFLLVGINAKYIHSNPGIYSLKAYAEGRSDVDVEIAEYTINQPVDSILEDIFVRKPDAVGFSCYIWNIEFVEKLVDELPKLLPNTKIWLGGPEVSYDSESVSERHPHIAGVIVGEGEKKFVEILKTLEGGTDCADKDLSPVLGEAVCMDDLPFFYENLNLSGDENATRNTADNFENRIIYYESQRGCPFRCSYCLSSIDKDIRYRSLELVKKDLSFFLEKKVKQVKFVDRTFNCNPDRTAQILKFLKENDNGVTNFHFEVAGDILTREEMEILKSLRPGQVQLEIGVQTTNPKTLEAINRRCDMEKLASNVDELYRKHNIHIHLDLIAGLPYEDYESFKKSFNKVYIMKPNQLQLGFLKVLKGTQIAAQTKDFGIASRDYPPYEVMYTNWITFDEICTLKKVEEMVETYYNSAQFTQSMRLLEEYFDTPFDMYLSLARFYESRGYFVKNPARSRKYEILLEFVSVSTRTVPAGTGKSLVEVLREALTVDYYLREKPKAKPDFVKELPKLTFDYERRDPLTGNFYLLK